MASRLLNESLGQLFPIDSLDSSGNKISGGDLLAAYDNVVAN